MPLISFTHSGTLYSEKTSEFKSSLGIKLQEFFFLESVCVNVLFVLHCNY